MNRLQCGLHLTDRTAVSFCIIQWSTVDCSEAMQINSEVMLEIHECASSTKMVDI